MADPRVLSAIDNQMQNSPDGVHSHAGEIRPQSGTTSIPSLSRIGSAQSIGLPKSGPSANSRGTFNPRMLQSRRDVELDTLSQKSVDSSMSHKSVSFSRKKPSEIRKVIGYDGQEHTLVSVDCQTEWSWLDDTKVTRRMATPHRYSRASTRGSLSMPGGAEAQEGMTGEDDSQSNSTISTKHTTSTIADSMAARVLSGGSQRTAVKKERLDTAPESAAHASGAHSITLSGVHLPSREDEYGIPMMELSSDSDLSDDDSANDTQTVSKLVPPVDHTEVGTLPSVGPPQILQFNRESDQKPLDVADPDTRVEGVETKAVGDTDAAADNDGPCEFCGDQIKPFPSVEQQRTESPSVLYCCSQYRELLDMMISKENSQNTDGPIDINPHPPYGSKQDRKAAKERAQQRFRERELARQQTSASMGGSHGGLSGSAAGNQLNYYNQFGLEELSEEEEFEEKGEKDKGIGEKNDKKKKGGGGKKGVSREKSFGLGMGAGVSGGRTSNFSGGQANYASYMHNEVTRQMKTINYQLSSQKCLDEGWTLRAPSPLAELDPDVDVFEPQPLLGQIDDFGLILKSYPSGNKYIIVFPDGTGSVFYPSGNVAISISAREPGLYTYIIQDDDPRDATVLGVFDADGRGTSYYSTGAIRLCLDPIGGLELDVFGNQRKKWNWKEHLEHVHAPPIQPITFSITNQVSVRVMSQENVILTFASGNRSCRFQIGSRLKYKAPDNRLPPIDFDEDKLFRDETKARIQLLFNKVSNLLKFPNSPNVNKISTPAHLTQKLNKVENMKAQKNARIKREKTRASGMRSIKVT